MRILIILHYLTKFSGIFYNYLNWSYIGTKGNALLTSIIHDIIHDNDYNKDTNLQFFFVLQQVYFLLILIISCNEIVSSEVLYQMHVVITYLSVNEIILN